MSAILARLDEISAAIAKLSGSPPMQPRAPVRVPLIAPREQIAERLQKRGIPSSTIRQVNIVLDELEKNR